MNPFSASGAVNPFSPAGPAATVAGGSVTANAVAPSKTTASGPVLQTTNAAARHDGGGGDAWLIRTLLPGLCGVFVLFV